MGPLRAAALAAIALGALAGCASRQPTAAPISTPSEEIISTFIQIGPTSAASTPAPAETSRPPVIPEPVSRVPIVRAYAWADGDDDPIANAATFTVVKGVTPRQALAILVDHPKTPVESPVQASDWADAQPADGAQFVEAGTVGGWTIILEPNGFRATDEKALDKLSRAGQAVVIYNDQNAFSSFQYARAGTMLRYFDTLLYSDYGGGPPLPQERGLGFGTVQLPLAESMALTQRLIGVRIRLADLEPTSYSVAVGADL